MAAVACSKRKMKSWHLRSFAAAPPCGKTDAVHMAFARPFSTQ